MGILDTIFGGERTFKKHAERLGNRRAQALDRQASIEFLGAEKSAAAVEALLLRFGYSTEPSITDQEEKQRVFDLVCSMGEVVYEPVRAFLHRAESLSWALKILHEILEREDYVTDILELVEKFDTDYERDPQRKIQAIHALEDQDDPRIAAAVVRFLADANETVRFHAANVALATKNEEVSRDKLLEQLVREESQRIRLRIAEGLAEVGWGVQGFRGAVEKLLPEGLVVQSSGVIKKRGS
jgi:HEAT repeat protein